MSVLEDSSGEGSYEIPKTQIKQSDSMQGVSVKIRFEKEAEASSSKTVPDHIGVPIFKGLKVYLRNHYSLNLETNDKSFRGLSQLLRPS